MFSKFYSITLCFSILLATSPSVSYAQKSKQDFQAKLTKIIAKGDYSGEDGQRRLYKKIKKKFKAFAMAIKKKNKKNV